MDLMAARRRLLMQRHSGLPSEYRQVEYIQSAVGAYIDSGIKMSDEMTFEVDFQLIEVIAAKYIMGVFNISAFYLYAASASQHIYFQTAFGTGWQNTSKVVDTNRHVFQYAISNGVMTLSDYGTAFFSRTVSVLSQNGILVAGSSNAALSRCKTYGAKFTVNGLLVSNLIPCVRIADSVAGMYDTVRNQFFTSAGSGSFDFPS